MNKNKEKGLVNRFCRISMVFVIILNITFFLGPNHRNYMKAQTLKIGIEAGHGNGDSGAMSCDGTVEEQSITLAIAQATATLLRGLGYDVDVFRGGVSGTLPKSKINGYSADAFIALHNDYCVPGNSGFKVSRYNGTSGTGKNGSGDASDRLVDAIWDEYSAATKLPKDTSTGHFTLCMRYYWALNPVKGDPIGVRPPKEQCKLVPSDYAYITADTPGAIIEMGWISGDFDILTSPEGQQKIASGISNSIKIFLGTWSQSSTATLLTMDVSGSMGENSQGGIKIDAAKSAANDIVNMIEQESQVGGVSHRLGLDTFTTDAALVFGLSSDYDAVRMNISNLAPLNRTNIGAGLIVANQALLEANPGEAKIIILLSDGMSNTGLSHDEIINGPVQEAANAGTCIYTVGFGDQGNLDEDLLRRIAAGSGCGEYFYAPDINELEKVYIRIRHVTTGNVLAEFNGVISQGQTVQAGTFVVPSGQEELAVSLHWPGSALDLQLVDPNGRIIDQNYQGANIATYSNLVYALIEKPINGNWDISVYGRDVPEGSAPYDAIISSRVGVVTVPVTTQFGPGILVVLLVLASGGVGSYVMVHRRKLAKLKLQSSSPLISEASLRAISGPTAGITTTLSITGLSIGRSRACNLQIQDFTVSRQHARLRYAQDNWFIQDSGSKGGTFVNGQKISASILKSGDHIKIGSSEFEFSVSDM